MTTITSGTTIGTAIAMMSIELHRYIRSVTIATMKFRRSR